MLLVVLGARVFLFSPVTYFYGMYRIVDDDDGLTSRFFSEIDKESHQQLLLPRTHIPKRHITMFHQFDTNSERCSNTFLAFFDL